MELAKIQQELRNQGLDGWLFFDHHMRDPLAYRVLGFTPPRTPTRRWYYLIPAAGEPRGLEHRIERGMTAGAPGGSPTTAGTVEPDKGGDKLAGRSTDARPEEIAEAAKDEAKESSPESTTKEATKEVTKDDKAKDDKAYAVDAVKLLLAGEQRWSRSALWQAVTKGAAVEHDGQIDIVLALWNNDLIVGKPEAK